MAGMHLFRRNSALVCLVALSFLACISNVNSFSVPQPLQPLRLRSECSAQRRTGLVMVLLPGDKKVDENEVKDSLKRFVDTAPQGIWHMVEKKVVPAAKAVIMKELNKNKPPPKLEETPVLAEEEIVSEVEESEEVADDNKVMLEAPDSSETMAKLQALLGRSVAEELEDFEYTG
eukprot:3546584-Rhodomonas_salina.2